MLIPELIKQLLHLLYVVIRLEHTYLFQCALMLILCKSHGTGSKVIVKGMMRFNLMLIKPKAE